MPERCTTGILSFVYECAFFRSSGLFTPNGKCKKTMTTLIPGRHLELGTFKNKFISATVIMACLCTRI